MKTLKCRLAPFELSGNVALVARTNVEVSLLMTVSFPEVKDVAESGLQAAPYKQKTIALVPRQTQQLFGLIDVWILIKRRIVLIASIILGCTTLAAIASYTLEKVYTARSEIVLERKDVRPFATDVSLQALDRDRSAAETELDVLESRQFAGRVVDRLELTRDPAYNPFADGAQIDGAAPSGVAENLKSLFDRLDVSETPAKMPTVEVQRNRVITLLLSQYSVSRSGDSLAVTITVDGQDPDRAAEIANTIATLYVESSLEFKQDERRADKERAVSSGGAVGFLRQGLAQPLLVALRTEEAELQQKKAELSSKFGKNHPQIIEAESQLASVHRMIDTEVQRILLDLEAEALKPSARVSSWAETPSVPSFPKPLLIIPIALVGSTILAFLLAVLAESTDTRIRSGRRIEELLQIPNLGYLPQTERASRGTQNLKVTPVLSSRFADAERLIYLACRASGAPHIVLITSCTQDTEDTSTAWGIAAAAVADGRSTVLIDFDFRGHRLSHFDKAPRTSSLLESYLRKETYLVDTIQTVPQILGLGFIDATSTLRGAHKQLNSKNLRDLLSAIRKSGYDFIVLHAPPVLTSVDTSWLSQLVEGVILSVSWGKTTETQLLDAASQLMTNRAPILGTVIDQVDPKAHERRQYGGSVIAETAFAHEASR